MLPWVGTHNNHLPKAMWLEMKTRGPWNILFQKWSSPNPPSPVTAGPHRDRRELVSPNPPSPVSAGRRKRTTGGWGTPAPFGRGGGLRKRATGDWGTLGDACQVGPPWLADGSVTSYVVPLLYNLRPIFGSAKKPRNAKKTLCILLGNSMSNH